MKFKNKKPKIINFNKLFFSKKEQMIELTEKIIMFIADIVLVRSLEKLYDQNIF